MLNSQVTLSAQQLQRGQQALRAGQPTEARRYLQAAIAANPLNEAAWLLLARLSAPRARLAYLAKALELNSANSRAREELRRARRCVAAAGIASVPAPGAPRDYALPGAGWWMMTTMLGLSLVWLFFGMRGWQFYSSTTMAFAPLLKDTLTPTPTNTPTLTPTPLPTDTPIPPTSTLEPPPPTAAPTTGGQAERWIDVNLSAQSLTAYEGQTPVYTFLVSTGLWPYPTVTGQYPIYVKYTAADMTGPGYYLPSVPYVMYFYEGYGLHGTYWHNNFGHPMSHGCINLRTEEAAWLFDWASVGTLVNIHD